MIDVGIDLLTFPKIYISHCASVISSHVIFYYLCLDLY